MKKYTEYKQSNFAGVGEDILQFWKENGIFEKSISEFEQVSPPGKIKSACGEG